MIDGPLLQMQFKSIYFSPSKPVALTTPNQNQQPFLPYVTVIHNPCSSGFCFQKSMIESLVPQLTLQLKLNFLIQSNPKRPFLKIKKKCFVQPINNCIFVDSTSKSNTTQKSLFMSCSNHNQPSFQFHVVVVALLQLTRIRLPTYQIGKRICTTLSVYQFSSNKKELYNLVFI